MFERNSLDLINRGAKALHVRFLLQSTVIAIGHIARRTGASEAVECLTSASSPSFWSARPWLLMEASGAIGLKNSDAYLADDLSSLAASVRKTLDPKGTPDHPSGNPTPRTR